MSTFLQKYKNLLPAAALAMLITVGSPAVALARGGDGSASSGTDNTTARTEVAHTETETEMHATSETGTSEVSGRNRVKAEASIKKMQEDHKPAKTAEQREKVCESRKNGLTTRLTSIATNSDRYLTRINEISAKATAYQLSNGTASGFTAETDAVKLAQINATKSVQVLVAASKATVDCTSPTVATDIATFKEAAATARTDLKTYKMAVKDYLKALKTLKTSTDETNTEAPKTTNTTGTTAPAVKETN